MMNSGMMNGEMMWGNGMWLGPLIMIAVIALVLALAVMMVKWMSGSSKGDNSLALLKERFAAGDIDKQEFEEKRTILRG
ncbi:MAG: SHOCT domain-containing protein [Rhizobiaceae bacterium]